MKNIAKVAVTFLMIFLHGCVHRPLVVPFDLTPGKVIPENEAIVVSRGGIKIQPDDFLSDALRT